MSTLGYHFPEFAIGAGVTVPTTRAGAAERWWSMPAVRRDPSSGRTERSGGPVGSTASRNGVSGGVKPRINGEQRVSEATRCRAGHQEVASRQAASRLLRCAPTLRVTCHNLLIRLAFMAGSQPPAVTDPFARTHRSRMSTPTSCVRQISALLRSHQQTVMGGYPFGHSAKPWNAPPAGEVVASSQCVRGADPGSPRSCPGPCCQSLASVALPNGRCRRSADPSRRRRGAGAGRSASAPYSVVHPPRRRNGTLVALFGIRPRLLQHPPRPQSHAAVCVQLRRSALRAKHVLGYSTHALAGPVSVERYENLPTPVLHRFVFLQRSISTDPHDRGWLPALGRRAYPAASSAPATGVGTLSAPPLPLSGGRAKFLRTAHS